MCIQIKYIFITLITCCLLGDFASAGESLEAEINKLKTIDHVTGNAVYMSGTPGDFFILSKVFIQKGTEKDFLKMAEDENPVVRCMGLLCLAQNKQSLNVLKEHIADRDIVHYCPGGCMVGRITVGGFVRELFNNANHLEYRAPKLPLLSKEELIGLDIEILSKDSTTSFHSNSERAILNAWIKEKTPISLPKLEVHQIIKAIGRLEVSPERRQFLASYIKDETLDDISRLAAASALTRDASETALSIIQGQRIYLNSIGQENWGDRFIETLRKRMSHEKLMKVVRAKHPRTEIGEVDDIVIKALSNSHPLALPDLTNDTYLRLKPSDVISKIAWNSLVEMSKNLEEFNQPWNTYSDTAYILDYMMIVREGDLTFDRVFTEERRRELEKNIKEAINNHFEQKQNRRNMN